MESGKEGVFPLNKEAQEQLSWWYEDINLKMDLAKEIKRLNNIIDELEKWLKGLINNFDDNVSTPILHEQMTIQIVYDYLQDLKKGNEKI